MALPRRNMRNDAKEFANYVESYGTPDAFNPYGQVQMPRTGERFAGAFQGLRDRAAAERAGAMPTPQQEAAALPGYTQAEYTGYDPNAWDAALYAKRLSNAVGGGPVDTRDAQYTALNERFSNVLNSIGEGGLRGGVADSQRAQAAGQVYAPAAAAIEQGYAGQVERDRMAKMGMAQQFESRLANEAARRTGFSQGEAARQTMFDTDLSNNAYNRALQEYHLNVLNPYQQQLANMQAAYAARTGANQALMDSNMAIGTGIMEMAGSIAGGALAGR